MSKYYSVNDVSRAIIELPDAENGYSGSYDKAEILNALEYLPTIEVSEDCISREWVKGICEMMLDEEMLGHMLGYIEDAPSVTTEQSSMVGEWKNTIGGIYACSNCNSSFTNIPKDGYWKPMWNYCPHCGAKMKG